MSSNELGHEKVDGKVRPSLRSTRHGTFEGRSALADLVIGTHSSLTGWVFEVVTQLATLCPSRLVRVIDRFDHVDFLTEQCPILLTNYPSRQLIDAVDRGDVRVYVAESPQQVLHYMQSALQLPILEAIRSQTASAVANRAIGRSQHALIISRDSTRTAVQAVRKIATHLQFPSTDEHFIEIAATASRGITADMTLEQALEMRADHYVSPSEISTAFSCDPLALACGEILTPILAMVRGDATRPIVWPTSVFRFADVPEAPAPLDPDVAGPVRNLYYGPYLYLPPGRYRVEAILEFSEEITAVPFVMEVHGGNWLVKARIDERRPGRYRGYFFLDHREPTATVEIRLRNENAISKGRLSLIELLFFVEDDN